MSIEKMEMLSKECQDVEVVKGELILTGEGEFNVIVLRDEYVPKKYYSQYCQRVRNSITIPITAKDILANEYEHLHLVIDNGKYCPKETISKIDEDGTLTLQAQINLSFESNKQKHAFWLYSKINRHCTVIV